MRGAGTRRRGSGPLSASSTPSARLRGRGHSEVCEGIGGQRRLKKAKTKNVNLCFFLATSLLSLLALPSEATECVCDAGNKKEPLKKQKRPFCNQKKGSQLTQVSPGHAFLPRSPGHHNQWQAGTERGAKGLLWHRPRCHRLAGHHQLCPDRRAAAGQGRLSER